LIVKSVLVLLLALCLSLTVPGCTDHTPENPFSDRTTAAVVLLTEQLGISEQTAIDVLAQLHRAGYDKSSLRMAFVGESEGSFVVWSKDTKLTITLDDAGLVATITDGDRVYVANTRPKPDGSQSGTDQGDEPSGNPPSTEGTLRLLSFSSPIPRGEKVTLTACGKPGQTYEISVRYASGESTAKGLEPQVAAADGSLSWTFSVSSRVSPGDYPVTISGDGEQLCLTLTVTAPQDEP
jgi:hypothetical protein